MRYLILLLISATLFAVDPPAKPLPAGVDPIVKEYQDAVAKAKAAYELACAKAQEKALDKLEAKNKEIIKKGDVDGAISVKGVIERIRTGKVREEAEKIAETDLLGVEKVDVIKEMVGSVWQYNRPDGEYIRLNKGGTVNVWWANKPFSNKNPTDDNGTWQKDAQNITIIFGGRCWKVTLYNNMNMEASDQHLTRFTFKKIE